MKFLTLFSNFGFACPVCAGGVIKRPSRATFTLFCYSERITQGKTHQRNQIILPEMVGTEVAVYNGKEYETVFITTNMVGEYLGEIVLTKTFRGHGSARSKPNHDRGRPCICWNCVQTKIFTLAQ